MFLNRLRKKEKVIFLKLAHCMARSNNNFDSIQKNIINGYCMEMQIKDIEYDAKKFNLGKELSKIKSKKTKKIILLEIMALVYSNNKIDSEEQEILDFIIKQFNIKKVLINIYGEWTKAILALSIQGESLLDL